MAHHDNEKVYVAKINWACLGLAILYLVLAIVAFAAINIDVSFVDLDTMTELADDPEALMSWLEFEIQANPAMIIGFMAMLVGSVFSIIALVNVIRLVVGCIGFVGKHDTRKMVKKLAKHAKLAFGTTISALALNVIFSTDNGVLEESVSSVGVFAGIVFGLTYLLVRFYRWFIVERESWKNYVFVLVRDAICITIPIILFSLVELDGLGRIAACINKFSGGNDRAIAAAVSDMFLAMVGLVVLISIFAIVKKIAQYMPFDNYKRSAAKAASSKYIPLVIFPLLLMVFGAISYTTTRYESFNIEAVKDYILKDIDLIIKLIIATVAANVLNVVENGNELDDVKIALPKNKAEEAPEAEAEESSEATEE